MLRVLMAAICRQSRAACPIARSPVSLKPARPSQPGGGVLLHAHRLQQAMGLAHGCCQAQRACNWSEKRLSCLGASRFDVWAQGCIFNRTQKSLAGLEKSGLSWLPVMWGETAFYTTCRVFLCFDAISSVVVYFGAQQVPRGARLGMPCGCKLHVAGRAGHHASDLCLMA